MRLLLHICCAPCSVMCIETLRKEGIEPTGFWYNPNIHPVTEYKARKNTLIEYARRIGMRLIVENDYGLRDFIDHVHPDYEHRCGWCYLCRLEETARYAAENGYDCFSTTLLISPYQKHDLIIKVAQAMAEKYGITFLYRDFRPYFKEGQEKARAMGLYMQKYCGCVFSEEDRYLERKKGLVTFQKFNNKPKEPEGTETEIRSIPASGPVKGEKPVQESDVKAEKPVQESDVKAVETVIHVSDVTKASTDAASAPGAGKNES